MPTPSPEVLINPDALAQRLAEQIGKPIALHLADAILNAADYICRHPSEFEPRPPIPVSFSVTPVSGE